MLQRLKEFIFFRKKRKLNMQEFASEIKDKYAVSKKIKYHSDLVLYKYKPKEKHHYHKTIQLVKEVHPAFGFDQFYSFINNLSYNNWSRLQNVIREKHSSYPSITPSVYHHDIKNRYIKNERNLQKVKTVIIQKNRVKTSNDKQGVKNHNELVTIKQELKENREIIHRLMSFIKEYEAGKVEKDRMPHDEKENAIPYAKTILYTTDLKKIAGYVMDELNENLTLERMRRGMYH